VRTSAGFDWDPSVRSLTAFPWVLDTMASHMRWTEDLGEAFRTQPGDVMDAVQHLRGLAYRNGTLRSDDNVRVYDTSRGIVIEAVEARVVHVPHYDSRVVYGTWLWPAYPPVYWPRWHRYVDVPHRHHVVHWGPGVSVAGGFFFGGFDWPRREVRIVNTRSYYYRSHVERHVDVHRHAHPAHVWRHDESRRGIAREQSRATAEQRQIQQQQREAEPRELSRREAEQNALSRSGRRAVERDGAGDAIRPREPDQSAAQRQALQQREAEQAAQRRQAQQQREADTRREAEQATQRRQAQQQQREAEAAAAAAAQRRLAQQQQQQQQQATESRREAPASAVRGAPSAPRQAAQPQANAQGDERERRAANRQPAEAREPASGAGAQEEQGRRGRPARANRPESAAAERSAATPGLRDAGRSTSLPRAESRAPAPAPQASAASPAPAQERAAQSERPARRSARDRD
jgi:hypothetical protein